MHTHTQLKRKDGTELQIHPSAEGKFCLIIDTSRGRQKITTKVKPAPLNKHTNICVARTERIKFIDTVISKNVMYGVTYYDINNIKHTILISKAGSMSEPINDIHRIPNDYMRNEKMLRRFLDKEFQILGYSYILQPTVQNKIKCNARKPKYYKYRKYRCN